jgi:hypothetical protein
MTNLARAARDKLAAVTTITTLRVDEVQTSRDGTRKLRLLTHDGRAIESVLIPDGDKLTQCISSQVGCAIDCQFCATAKMGLVRNLEAGEIADQVYRARALLAEVDPGRRITNLVYMGMGEPLHNYDNVIRSLQLLTHELGAGLSQRRITVSTAGLVPGIDKLGRETASAPTSRSRSTPPAIGCATRSCRSTRSGTSASCWAPSRPTRSSTAAASPSSTCCSPGSTTRSTTPPIWPGCCAATAARSTSSRSTRTRSRSTGGRQPR